MSASDVAASVSNAPARRGNQELQGLVVIVTGGGTGIGRATALACARRGAKVLITGRRPEPLRETEAAAPGIRGVTADVTVASDARSVVEEAAKLWGRIDVVVNNAGMFASGPFEKVGAETAAQLFATNVFGPINLVREALPWLKESRGAIINVSSTYGHKAAANVAHYAASKAALDHLTRCWALELAPYGIRVNAVAPGPTEMPILSRSGLPEDVVASIKEAEKRQIPLGRRGEPDDVAAWIVALAAPGSHWLTGQVIGVDGGLSLA
ncbi:SDR family NAD(P)-dependent oxidoreductase [Symbiobacterium thermophilum]|uniref:SDR family NAD(P)-dependent oxidoreductase n=1 Tax=Symbiobacterium thermophilum TaxID=2734 RepID=UPI0035C69794